MEQNPHNLQEQKYPRPEYFFQAIEMANEEVNSELDLEADFFSWKVVKRRQKPQRRYTVSHAAPPAPPSTPTSLSKEHDPLSDSMSPVESNSGVTANGNSIGNGHGISIENDESRLGSLLYILDYAPKYKKKLKEQQRTDAELAELFKVVTITGSGSSGHGHTKGVSSIEHVSGTSRRIRRHEMNPGLFKIHRNPDESIRDLADDEDSLSAPEFEVVTTEKMAGRRWRRLQVGKHREASRLQRYKSRAKQYAFMKGMDDIIDTFDSTMNIQPAK